MANFMKRNGKWQARAMLGGANGDLQATRTSNGWTFSGDGYTATVGDDGSVEHN